MDRRRFLALSGAGLAGLAGCTSGAPDEGTATTTVGSPSRPDSPPTTGSATETTTGPDTELAVEFDALQAGALELNVDYFGMIQFTDTQYLYLDVAVASGPVPALSDLAFRFDGEEHRPSREDEIYRMDPYVGGDENDSGWVLFALPETGDASDAALVWPGGEWGSSQRIRERLAAPLPTLNLEWSVPETVLLNSTPTFGFTVRNEGEHDGRFVRGINETESLLGGHRTIGAISRRIPAGETRSWTMEGHEITLPGEEFEDEVGDGEPDFEYELIWPGQDLTRSLEIVEERTPTDESGG